MPKKSCWACGSGVDGDCGIRFSVQEAASVDYDGVVIKGHVFEKVSDRFSCPARKLK